MYSLCNKVIQNKIVVLLSQSLSENKDISKKKKKKKNKKKIKTPENFPLFEKNPCTFFESPEIDKNNFCEMWTLSQMIVKDLIINSIKTAIPEETKQIISPTNTIKITEHCKLIDVICSPPKEKEHIEHRIKHF